MKKILKFLNDYLEETICIILMSVMTIIIFIQVIMRYVMHKFTFMVGRTCKILFRLADLHRCGLWM